MKALIVVNREEEWPHRIPGAAVVTSKAYLTREAANSDAYERVINLCRCDRAHGPGFYVSLLAEARGQEPLPSARAVEDLQSNAKSAPILEEIERLVEQSLDADDAREIDIHSYFGADPEARHAALSQQLFALLKTPLLRAVFRRKRGRWRLARIRALTPAEVPAAHRDALVVSATRFITGQPRSCAARRERKTIAILHSPNEPLPPSNREALQNFVRAAQLLGMHAETIDRHAIERLPEFDALFIRDTTFLEHYTYKFAQRAAALGLVVVDDPHSILQCNNKVYLNELFTRHGIRIPKTLMVHRDNVGDVARSLALPVVLKEPGGGFSLGVCRADTQAELAEKANAMLEKSELIIAQQWLPTGFDWRVGVFDRRALYVCKYFMAPGHWQVHKYEPGQHVEGATTAHSVGEVPAAVVNTAVRAANLIGESLYGVDLKLVDGQVYVMEINDNPNVDAGNEDGVLKDALYREIMGVFLRRIRERQQAPVA